MSRYLPKIWRNRLTLLQQLTIRSRQLKLLELNIRNVRGLTRLDLIPEGETFAIVGNNGTGKSAVVDAIDFLLTGDMERLTGRRGASLRHHGKHIKAQPQDSYVIAKINVPGTTDPVTLRRSFVNPDSLEVTPPKAIAELKPFLEVASRRQYVLTRRNILRFISAEPRDRAALVQAVLNLDRVEELRKILTTAANAEKQRLDDAHARRVSAEGAVCKTLNLIAYNDKEAIDAVNRLRELLGGSATDLLKDIKKNLIAPGSVPDVADQLKLLHTDPIVGDIIRVGKSVSNECEIQLNAWDEVLRTEIVALSANPESSRLVRQMRLVELGIALLDDATKCPLCDTTWDPEHLKVHLAGKAESGKAATPSWKRIRETADSLLHWLADTEGLIAGIIGAGRYGEEGSDPAPLAQYSLALSQLRASLADPLSLFRTYREEGRPLCEQLGLSAARELLRDLYRERRPKEVANPTQTAWDTLTRADENFKTLNDAIARATGALISARRLEAIRVSFIDARNKVLGELYNSVKDRFIALYKQLHSPEEQEFDADMTPGEAGLSLEVDFYGMGKAAPFALHSEGHQDSMGLCLFLALVEKMQGARLGFCLLDDVVMAIDAGHRLNVAKLLCVLKKETQFLIATHDRMWTRQLQAEHCIDSQACLHFIGWSLDGGPVVASLTDFLEESQAALAAANIRDAAASLRYGLESYFHFVADSIRAQPPYSLSGQYDMGQMYSACNGKLKELIKEAKKAAESWSQPDVVADLTAFEKRRSEVLDNLQTTQWAVNVNVHFNTWTNMIPDEFRPVLQAFRDVCSLFTCEACGSILKLILNGATPKSMGCACGKMQWNLEKQR